ncbi:MAG: hypothetical protein KAQ93_05930 [Spirochaetales bacterium]|nr:hypothetical protein [Spirochaetales bacterium]
MKKKIVVLIFFTLAVINTIIAGLWISDIGRKTELLVQRKENAVKLDSSLYDNTSLKLAISKLEEEIFIEKSLKRKEGDTLKMTEDVLRLLEQNRIKVISYRLEGEDNREELAITAEGELGSVLKLIYDLSFSKEGFRINFISVDARFRGRPATLVIRITYA